MAGFKNLVTAWRHDGPALAIVVLGTLIGLVVFAPWRPPLPVSDTWVLLEAASQRDLADVLSRFVPNASEWYRPITELAYFLTWHVFGTNAALSFPLHVVAHAIVAALLAAICFRLTQHRAAAAATGVAFLLTLSAHEVVFDYASTHRLLGGIAMTAGVLAWVSVRRRLALSFVIGGLLVDEAGLIVAPILVLYELIYRDISTSWRVTLVATARRVAPVIVVVGVYLVARLAVGGFYNEATNPCRSPECLGVAGMEYVSRLVVRGDWLLERLWYHRPLFLVAVVGTLLIAAVATQIWRWPDRRLLAFGLGWAAVASAFFVLTLWPYVADRFFYVAQMGASLVIGAVVVGLARTWPRSSPLWRAAAVVVVLAAVAWIGLGAQSILYRGERWVAAGDYALSLSNEITAVAGTPEPGSVVVIRGVPQFLRPLFPPGNTGPYVYINGLPADLRLRHGWNGMTIYSYRPLATEPSPPSDVLIQVTNGVVTRIH